MAQSIEVRIEGRVRTTTTAIDIWRPSQNATWVGILGPSTSLSCRRIAPAATVGVARLDYRLPAREAAELRQTKERFTPRR